MKKLSDSESDIMLVIWEAEGPVKSSYIRETLKEKEWAHTTVLNFLARLVDKGYLKCKSQGRNNIYTPLITKEEYLQRKNKGYLKKFYKSSIRNMVAELYETEVISDEDLEGLKEFIDEKIRKEV